MANGCLPGNYVAARRRVPVRGRPMRKLRNISRAATYAPRCCMQHLGAHLLRELQAVIDSNG